MHSCFPCNQDEYVISVYVYIYIYRVYSGSPKTQKTKLFPLVVRNPESMDRPKDQPLCLVFGLPGYDIYVLCGTLLLLLRT